MLSTSEKQQEVQREISAFAMCGSRQARFAMSMLETTKMQVEMLELLMPALLVSNVSADFQQRSQVNYNWPRCVPQYSWYWCDNIHQEPQEQYNREW